MQVLEVRNRAKQGVLEGEEIPDWDFYTEPYLSKCELLLQVPPLCPLPKQNQGKRLLAAAHAIKDSCSWDKIVSAVRARQVFKRYRFLLLIFLRVAAHVSCPIMKTE